MEIEPITIPSITPLAQAYLVHNVLTAEECKALVRFIDSTPHLDPMFDRDSTTEGVSTRFVSSNRAVIRSPDLASFIWSRLLPVLESYDNQIRDGIDLSSIEGDPFMVGNSYRMHGSIWKPSGLNDVWRMARYDAGGHFGPHRDGVLHIGVNCRSMKTMMIYLNGDEEGKEFKGGTTNFIEEQEMFEDERGKIRARDDTILHRVHPRQGTCIIFNHALLHEGSALLEGQKYILRSEILFSRAEPLRLSEKEDEAVQCRAEAEKLESDGKYDEAVKWSERKVLNKYFPPDFDPSKIPRRKMPKDQQHTVRLMTPFSMRCVRCGEYIYKGKKFNARKERVEGENYLGIQSYRFYIKCPVCSSEITFKTDYKNADYVAEHGAQRNFEPWRDDTAAEDSRKAERAQAEENNPMKALENRTLDSKREMDILDALDEIRTRNARNERVDADSLLGKIIVENALSKEEEKRRQEDEDDRVAKAIFQNVDGDNVRRLLDDEPPPIEYDATPFGVLPNEDPLLGASASLGLPKTNLIKPASAPLVQSTLKRKAESDALGMLGIVRKKGKAGESSKGKEVATATSSPSVTGSVRAVPPSDGLSALAALGDYGASDDESDEE
ncbi:hypothetical protein HK097_001597 [Rhizophlyctis rosea]|uniref:Splicing factor YJU2 n=1 Tax=Rhizophlyctis rosea TaxID=64517 RepID=A0AAD5X841_9FUNG|nr:hypothetical protein HK097_001597 [Rhizophlyctis rosea]